MTSKAQTRRPGLMAAGVTLVAASAASMATGDQTVMLLVIGACSICFGLGEEYARAC